MNENEKIFAKFVIDKLESAGGCLKFQHITGHLSQLDEAVRKAVGTKPTELMKFLRKHDDLFITDKSGMVSLRKAAGDSNSRNDNSSESESGFPSQLRNHEGIVIKVLPSFGFIASKKPKSTIYFTPACFKNEEKKCLLTDLVHPGQKVCFDARRGDTKFESKYQAIRVWKPEKVENEILHPEGFQKFRKTRDTGLFDPPSTEGTGKVQKVFDTYGFIIIDKDPRNTVYFTKKNVCNVENVLDLTKIMKEGDDVEYIAVRSSKKDSKTRWQANKVWLKTQLNPPASKNSKNELKRNVKGRIYPNSNGAVIKFGPKFEQLADADSCLFYMHGIKVTDVCWEFSDGDNVEFDVISIKSAPGWKALLCWIGQRPNVILPVDLGDFSGFPDDEMDDIHESGSFTSKTSGISASSGASQNSEMSKNSIPLSSKAQNSHERYSSSKHRNSRGNKKSDFQGTPTRSLSHSSRSSPHSNKNEKTFHRSKSRSSREFKGSQRSMNSNSYKSHSRCENDSGFGSDQYMSWEQKSLNSNKHVRGYNSNDDNEENAYYEPTKPILKSDNLKKSPAFGSDMHLPWQQKHLNTKDVLQDCDSNDYNSNLMGNHLKKSDKCKSNVYTNWGDSPYPDEENESDPDVFSEVFEETSGFDKKLEESENSTQLKYASHEKFEEEIPSNDELSDSEADFEITDNEMRNENTQIDIQEEDGERETAVESMLEETSNDADAVFEESQIQPYIKRFSDLCGKILKVYCKYAEIENEVLKKSTSFFWTDLYCNGRPAPDHFDNLNEVLRQGQSIKFNCIEIVDDSGSCWHKITMAWKGQKPRIIEMTPEEFISENHLVVSASEVLNEYEVTNTSHENTEQPKPTRKFLTLAIEDEEPEDSSSLILEPSGAAAATKEPGFQESLTGSLSCRSKSPDHNEEVLSCDSDDLQESLSSFNLMQLTEAVGKMFLSYRHSETDVDVIASDVVSFVLSKAGTNHFSSSAAKNSFCDRESQTESVSLVASLGGSSVNHRIDMTETSAQTIITGEIIAQSTYSVRMPHVM